MSEKPSKPEERVKDIIESLFQMERLDRLCMGSVFLRVAYAELIGNINYAILAQRQDDPHDPSNPEVTSILVGNIQFPITARGRFGAAAQSFRHFANKLDDFLSAANVSTVLGSVDFVKDIAMSTLTGTRVSQSTTSRPYIHPGDVELLKK